MDLVAVELSVRRCAEVVLDVSGTGNIFGQRTAALEFIEDCAIGLAHDVGQDVQPPAMRHADDDIPDAKRPATLDDLLHRGNQSLGSIKAETLRSRVLHMEKLFQSLRFDELVENGPASFLSKLYLLAVALDSLLEPAGLLRIGDVHVLQSQRPAVSALDQFKDLAQRCDLKTQNIVDEDRPIHVGFAETVCSHVQFGMGDMVHHPQGVKLGDAMAANPVCPDQHKSSDRI